MKRRLLAIVFGFLLLQSAPSARALVPSRLPGAPALTGNFTLRDRLAARAAARKKRLERSARAQPEKPAPLLPASTVSGTGSSLPAVDGSHASRALLQRLRAEVLILVNGERAKAGLPPLRMQLLLEQAAQEHATDMQEHAYFSHDAPDGRTVEKRIGATGYLRAPCSCSWVYTFGENIAEGFGTPEKVMDGWMRSPDHRENILRAEYREIGIGIRGTVWVQDFGAVYEK